MFVFSSLQSTLAELVLSVKTHERCAVVTVLKIRYQKDGFVEGFVRLLTLATLAEVNMLLSDAIEAVQISACV